LPPQECILMRRTSRGGGRWVVGDEKLFSKRELPFVSDQHILRVQHFLRKHSGGKTVDK
jgi:hypothetical protein